MRKLACLVALLLLGATIPAFAQTTEPVDNGTDFACTDALDQARPLTIAGTGATGQYAVPDTAATTLIVFGHGYGHISDSWVEHMKRAATDHGVVSVAMDYRGSYKDSAGNNRGWFVKEGAEDMIAAAHLFQDSCTTIDQTIIFGVSMGGNSTGLAVAQAAGDENATGGPLFDYWFDVEGAVNVLETYAGASALAGSGNAFANNAKADIEDEMNGTPDSDPEGYADLAVVNHVDEIV
ncbi:MAG: hypothetical protein QOG04_1528, partial [Actinomycetota bacterium]|nr:hypothetical protein [Actinomycetota bacterium]